MWRTLTIAGLVWALGACAPSATPPAPEPEVREIEEQQARKDSDRVGPLGIPEAELPNPGECRVWYPGRAAAEQAAAGACGDAESDAPAGSWVLYRPPDDQRVVHARVIDPARAGVVTRINLYDVEKGTYLGTKPVEEESGQTAP
jgi:hypothetical protein